MCVCYACRGVFQCLHVYVYMGVWCVCACVWYVCILYVYLSVCCMFGSGWWVTGGPHSTGLPSSHSERGSPMIHCIFLHALFTCLTYRSFLAWCFLSVVTSCVCFQAAERSQAKLDAVFDEVGNVLC